MAVSKLRRLLFDRLFMNLAMVLGAAQMLVWHWATTVVGGQENPGLLGASLGLGLLVAFNAYSVPALRRARRRSDLGGFLARAYMNFGVATLLLGVTVAAAWIVFLVPAGLLGAVGASAELAYGLWRGTSIAVVGSVALLLLWGFTVGQSLIARTRHTVRLAGLDSELSGLRITQISDLHIGNFMEGERLDRMVARVNAVGADVIVLTGDIFDFDPSFVEDGARRLDRLRARHGVYAILGNHDTYTGTEKIVDAIERLAPNLRLLRDEVVPLPVSAPLYLAGVEDPGRDWSAKGIELEGLNRVAAARPGDGPTLLLVHRPEAFAQAARLGFPFVMAGHTHGGQMALPTPGGHYNLARVMTSYTRGLFRDGDTMLYVNRGLGVAGPAVRINCSREIATFELVPA